jgi:hypothetical protein
MFDTEGVEALGLQGATEKQRSKPGCTGSRRDHDF